eukprot:4261190-Amphidinium_carterae.1
MNDLKQLAESDYKTSEYMIQRGREFFRHVEEQAKGSSMEESRVREIQFLPEAVSSGVQGRAPDGPATALMKQANSSEDHKWRPCERIC